MRRIRVNPDRPDPVDVTEAMGSLRRGEILAFPTDTLYGLTCDPRNPLALASLYRLKARPGERRLPFIAADISQAARLVSFRNPAATRLAERFWPGPLTLVLPLIGPHHLALFDWGSDLAIRVPGSALARALAARAGVPLPATSANRSGEPPVFDPDRFHPSIKNGLGLLLDAGRLGGRRCSTILDLTGAVPRLLRRGSVSPAELAPVLGGWPAEATSSSRVTRNKT